MKKTILGAVAMLMLAGATLYAANGNSDKSNKSNTSSCSCSKDCCKDCGSKDCSCCKK